MIGAHVDATSAAGYAGRLRVVGELVDPGMESLVTTYGRTLETRVKARASGRPGPNAPSGDYRRSIGMRKESGNTAVVGTNRPQGRRLEFGFHGVDAIGRSYAQPPYPHFQPAIDETRPEFVQAVGAFIQGLSP